MNIKPEIAILKKELIEHKGALFIAPAVLIVIFFVLVTLQTFILGAGDTIKAPAHEMFIVAFFGAASFFFIYTIITLFFYYADSFSADRKNNGLLFWKSLPISDLKILALKLFFGTLLIPVIILGWVMVSSIASYLIGVLNFGEFENFIAPWTAIFTLLKLSLNLLVILAIVFLWLAPFYAWVGMLSTFFKKWSIGLAFIIPLVLISIEEIFSFDAFQTSFLADFIANRLVGIVDHAIENNAIFNDSMKELGADVHVEINGKPYNFQGGEASMFVDKLETITWHFISNVKWISLGLGLVVSGIFIYIGSEYRRRFIQG